ncbi:MAG: PilN domain-containing protein [Vicinamibacterales bacterium]
MIRINLLGVERPRARKAFAFDIGQRLTLAAGLIVVAGVAAVGWWYLAISRESSALDTELAAARQEATRLRSLMAEVQQFEAQREQLRQRVALITELRSGQSIPVQLLDHVSRSLPDMLWLTTLEQEGDQVTMEGRSTTLIALSDFVGSLSGGTLLQKPIEIVNSQVQPAGGAGAQATPELIQFTVRGRINRPGQKAAEEPAARGRGARGGRGAAARGRQTAPR